jgi:hypothetical protein
MIDHLKVLYLYYLSIFFWYRKTLSESCKITAAKMVTAKAVLGVAAEDAWEEVNPREFTFEPPQVPLSDAFLSFTERKPVSLVVIFLKLFTTKLIYAAHTDSVP